METYSIEDIVQVRGNIILAANEDLGAICTANGSYFQVWQQVRTVSGVTRYECLEAYDMDSRMDAQGRGLYGMDTAALIDAAEKVLFQHYLSDTED